MESEYELIATDHKIMSQQTAKKMWIADIKDIVNHINKTSSAVAIDDALTTLDDALTTLDDDVNVENIDLFELNAFMNTEELTYENIFSIDDIRQLETNNYFGYSQIITNAEYSSMPEIDIPISPGNQQYTATNSYNDNLVPSQNHS